MASNTNMNSPTYTSDPTSPNTTFVQADPSTFRAVVQKLTGAPEDPSSPKLPLSLKPHHHHSTTKPTTATTEMGPRKPTFKLHERRHHTKKLELNIDNTTTSAASAAAATTFNNKQYCISKLNFNTGLSPFGPPSSSSSSCSPAGPNYKRPMIFSPVSPLEFYARGSPRTPREAEEEEEKAIAEKGYYLHPSPLSTPRGSDPPELLPLFPLHSPRGAGANNLNSSSCSS